MEGRPRRCSYKRIHRQADAVVADRSRRSYLEAKPVTEVCGRGTPHVRPGDLLRDSSVDVNVEAASDTEISRDLCLTSR